MNVLLICQSKAVYLSNKIFVNLPNGHADNKNPLFRKQQKSFINVLIVKVHLKYKQKPRKIIVQDFILCSVARIAPLISNTFSCSNKLLLLRQTYPC